MPEIVNYSKMEVGHKGSGKHWTKKEVENRTAAAQKLKSKTQAKMKMPIWLDEEARRVWKKTLKEMAEFDLLEKVDEEGLAIYCDSIARHQEASLKVREEGFVTINAQGTETVSPNVKAAQSYARQALQYSDKYGLNANSRARLAKKMAEKEDDPNADLFD